MCVPVCVSMYVVSESQVFSRRQATSQPGKEFIDWWGEGDGKKSCKLKDLNKVTHRSPSPDLYGIPDPFRKGFVLRGKKTRKQSYSQSWFDVWFISFINCNYQLSLKWFSLMPICDFPEGTTRIWDTRPRRE